jgi:hypothetical protein
MSTQIFFYYYFFAVVLIICNFFLLKYVLINLYAYGKTAINFINFQLGLILTLFESKVFFDNICF